MFECQYMHLGVPIMARQKQIWLGSMRTQVRSLALFSGFRIQCCCELWCSRPAAAALIWSLAWELPYAPGAALKRKKKKEPAVRGGHLLLWPSRWHPFYFGDSTPPSPPMMQFGGADFTPHLLLQRSVCDPGDRPGLSAQFSSDHSDRSHMGVWLNLGHGQLSPALIF